MGALWKIPKHARKVYDGRMIKIYQWRQKLYDGTYATYEMGVAPPVVLVIAVKDGKIIMTRQRQPHTSRSYFGFLGGHIEMGETPLQAAKRELLEESGFVAGRWKLLKKEVRSGRLNQTFYYYSARDCRKVAGQNLDAGEKIRLIELDTDGFLDVVARITSGNFGVKLAEIRYNKARRRWLERELFQR